MAKKLLFIYLLSCFCGLKAKQRTVDFEISSLQYSSPSIECEGHESKNPTCVKRYYSVDFENSKVFHAGFLSYVPNVLKKYTRSYENYNTNNALLYNSFFALFSERAFNYEQNEPTSSNNNAFPVTGISNNHYDDQSEIKVKVYPLPFSEKLSIESKTNGVVSLFNVLGDIVMQQSIKSGTLELFTSNLTNGIYILKINQGESVFIKKIMKR